MVLSAPDERWHVKANRRAIKHEFLLSAPVINKCRNRTTHTHKELLALSMGVNTPGFRCRYIVKSEDSLCREGERIWHLTDNDSTVIPHDLIKFNELYATDIARPNSHHWPPMC